MAEWTSLHYASSVHEKRASSIGQSDTVLVPVQQTNAELRFELINLPADRRLGYVDALSRPRETQFFRDGDEIAQLP